MKPINRRVDALEKRANGGGNVLVLFVEKNETSEQRLARWEAENGPVGDRHVLAVNFVDAAI